MVNVVEPRSKSMRVSDYIAAFLHAKGMRTVFELSGGMIVHMLDSLHRRGDMNIVSMRHEQAAAFAADAFGRVTGIPGVAMATSGPGAVNLLTGVGSCYFDSSPALFITGQVNRNEQRGDRNIRELGFQETDVVGMVGPITKAALENRSPGRGPREAGKGLSIDPGGPARTRRISQRTCAERKRGPYASVGKGEPS